MQSVITNVNQMKIVFVRITLLKLLISSTHVESSNQPDAAAMSQFIQSTDWLNHTFEMHNSTDQLNETHDSTDQSIAD